ncbi:MAG: efflux RND transporter permease subunit [Planctomycetota bacterium]|nr:efflux RND transporter permease subunit [Planctomycetota bacterium]
MIRAIAAFSVKNPVAVNLATITVIIAGVAAYLGMPREVFPDFSLNNITVTTYYPGAAPEDVERLVTLPIEERLEGITGLKEYSSRSQEGLSTIHLVVYEGEDMSRVVDDVRAAVQSGDLELPEVVEDPVVREIKAEWQVIGVFVFGYAPELELRRIADRHKRELEKIDGVAQVIVAGYREPRVWVEVDPIALERFGLSLETIGQAVGRRSADAPLGSLTTDSGDYLLRVESGVEWADDLRDLPLIHRPDGTVLRLADVALVIDTFERPVTLARFNGQPAIYLKVNKKTSGDAIDISAAVWEYIGREQVNMPAGVALGVNGDMAVYIKNRLRVMRDSATLGGLLVLCALVAFLNLRVAGMTALGIPVSFLGGIAAAAAIGISMNMIVMFALIIVLGMIVDDAIVVGENAYRLMEEGMSPEQAAIEGTAEVGRPVTAAILTTIAAFLPILLMGGMMGEFMRPLPLIVSLCLVASLFEALFVLPSHLAHWSGKGFARAKGHARHWYEPLRERYEAMLKFMLRWRWVSLTGVAVGTALLIGVSYFQIPFVLFDDFESKVFSIDVRTHPGTSMERTEEIVAAIERDLIEELPGDELESTNIVAGISYLDANQFSMGENLGQVWVELREDVSGRRSTLAIIEGFRERYRVPPPGVESIGVLQPQAGPTGRAIAVSIRGPELAVLKEIADELKGRLAEFRGVRDVRDNAETGKRQVRVVLKDEGRLLGFTEEGLARELRAAFEGVRFGRVRRGRDDVEIHVKLPEELRTERSVLNDLRVDVPAAPGAPIPGAPSMSERRVPLGLVADLVESSGPVVITRDDGERSVRVTADVNKQEGNTATITATIQEEYRDLGRRYPGYTLEFKGEQQDMTESFEGLKASLLVAVLMIYLILGTLFKSFAQPLVIMVSIPFGAVGMIIGHVIMDRPISFMSLMGFVALAGIVVNDSLILVDFVNNRRAKGMGLVRALIEGGRLRFRPILLTSITTMLGLSPLAFFASGQARFLQPMAITIFFGLACSTFLILLIIPCAYAALEDLVVLARHPWRTLRLMWHERPVHEPTLPIEPEDALA